MNKKMAMFLSIQPILHSFSHLPHWLATFFMGMLPVVEIKLAISVAILHYKMSVFSALFWAILGNMLPVTLILIFVERFHRWVEKQSGMFASNWIKFIAKTQKKFDGKYEKWGLIGLAIFIGLPFPGSGAWTGAMVAFLFALPFVKSWLAIFIGVTISALFTLGVVLGAIRIF